MFYEARAQGQRSSSMNEPKKDKLLSSARRLYADGLSTSEVADALGTCQSTISRWKRSDKERGRDWEEEREQRRLCRPDHVMNALDKRFGRMVAEIESTGGDESVLKSRYEERLLKLLKVIDLYRDIQGDPAAALSVMEGFVRFCVRSFPEDKLEPIREAVESYLRHLKRKDL